MARKVVIDIQDKEKIIINPQTGEKIKTYDKNENYVERVAGEDRPEEENGRVGKDEKE